MLLVQLNVQLIRDSIGPIKTTNQTVSWSVQMRKLLRLYTS